MGIPASLATRISLFRAWWKKRVTWLHLLALGVFAAYAAVFLLLFVPAGFTRNRGNGQSDVTFDISPDGKTLVFNGAGAGGRDLFVLDLKSSRVTSLGATAEYEYQPRFSPDGRTVVYSANTGHYADYLFIRSVSGGASRQLTNAGFNDHSPRFSPDGSRIVFLRDKEYVYGGKVGFSWYGSVVCIMKFDGTGLHEIPIPDVALLDAFFEEDAESVRIIGADLSGQATHLYAISIKNAPHTGKLHLINENFPASYRLAVSPDRQSIAFSDGQYSGDVQIFLANADGTNAHPLNPNVRGVTDVVFRPGKSGLFYGLDAWPHGGFGESTKSLWQIDLDGKNAKRVADSTLFASPLTWQPSRTDP